MLSQNNIMGDVMNAPLDTIAIPLTRGYSTVISAEDADLAQLKWYAAVTKSGLVYARRTEVIKGVFRYIYLHGEILIRKVGIQIASQCQCDHVNGDTLLNTRHNLRPATVYQNTLNKKPSTRNTSGAVGVYWYKASSNWRAFIQVNGKQIHLGSFTDFGEAVAIRREAEIRYFGEFSPILSRQDNS